MKGKNTKKKKTLRVVLLGLSFLMVIVLTASLTLAWFYDADWSSKFINMAGSVGIEIREQTGVDGENNPTYATSSGAGKLHFNISTNKAYPGQAIDASASVYNNGGRSGSGGSASYVRAHFAVYTNIGMDLLPGDGYDETVSEGALNAEKIYEFLRGLVNAQNKNNSSYVWKYYQHTGSTKLSASGVEGGTIQHWYEGKAYDTVQSEPDKGYYYLCHKGGDENILAPLAVGQNAVFLWNGTFVIPWTLTNYSADKQIFVMIVFEAIQTFIPVISTDGIISGNADNQLIANQCTYDAYPVQTVFNSCNFNIDDAIKKVYVDGDGNYVYEEGEGVTLLYDFSDTTKYAPFTTPPTHITDPTPNTSTT